MKCPKCGYRRRNSDNEFVPTDECPACGIVYSKHTASAAEASATEAPATETDDSGPILRPSPVDAESLKKARERVDRRLNERLAEQTRDARRDQTLELARRLATEGVRQRQEQWKQKQTAELNPMNGPEADEKPAAPTQCSPEDDMELVRRLTAENVHPRQEQWEQQQTAELNPMNGSETDEKPAAPTRCPPEDDMDRNLQAPVDTAAIPQESPPDATAVDADEATVLRDLVPATGASIQTNDAEAIRAVPDEPEQVAAATAESPDSTPGAPLDQDPAGTFTTDDTVLMMETDTPGNEPTAWLETPPRQQTHISPPAASPEDAAAAPQADDLTATSVRSNHRTRRRWFPKWGLSRLLPIVAWLILIAGISGAILSWTTLTEAEANIQPQANGGGHTIDVGLLLGFAYLVTGVLGFAFFWVSSLISRQLKDIRRLLLLQPPPSGQPVSARPFETIEDMAATAEEIPASTK